MSLFCMSVFLLQFKVIPIFSTDSQPVYTAITIYDNLGMWLSPDDFQEE